MGDREGRHHPPCLHAVALLFLHIFGLKGSCWVREATVALLSVENGKREDIDAVTLLSSIDFAAQVQISGSRHIDDEGRGRKWPKLTLKIKLLPNTVKYKVITNFVRQQRPFGREKKCRMNSPEEPLYFGAAAKPMKTIWNIHPPPPLWQSLAGPGSGNKWPISRARCSSKAPGKIQQLEGPQGFILGRRMFPLNPQQF